MALSKIFLLKLIDDTAEGTNAALRATRATEQTANRAIFAIVTGFVYMFSRADWPKRTDSVTLLPAN
jgi:hypothetical protein